MEAFKQYIQNYTNLSNEDWLTIQQMFERKELNKDEIILEQGKICKHFYFLEQGMIRFSAIVEGNDITKMFTIAPGCFTSKTSFRNQKPAEESIQSLERSVIYRVHYSKMEELSRVNSWNNFIRKLLYQVDEFTEEFLMEIKTETAEERYQKLREKYPTIIQKIPLRHLSSFLGIAPQSLSRIRKKIHENRKS